MSLADKSTSQPDRSKTRPYKPYTKTEASTRDRLHLLKHAFRLIDDKSSGSILEFGVRTGTSFLWMNRQLVGTQLDLVGFDSFEGLPAETKDVWRPERHAEGKMAIPFDSVNTKIIDRPGARTELVKGWFEDTLTPAIATNLSTPIRLVNLDCDLHLSTETVLNWLTGLLAPGTLLHFDDWVDDKLKPWGQKRAFGEWRKRHPGIKYEVCGIADHGRRIIEIKEVA